MALIAVIAAVIAVFFAIRALRACSAWEGWEASLRNRERLHKESDNEEVGITPEMIDAGAEALLNSDECDPFEVATLVYRAMSLVEEPSRKVQHRETA